MGRLSIYEPSVRELVDKTLVPLWLRLGSVNAVADTLNQLLRENGVQETIYPNRLHALFAEDSGRGLNGGTVELLKRASAQPGAQVSEGPKPETFEQVSREAMVRWGRTNQSPESLRKLAGELKLPAAVLRYLLNQHGARVTNVAMPSLPVALSGAGDGPVRRADWSFQDEAVRKVVAKLTAAPGARTGLVIPTGGGKTRVGLRTAIELLSRDSSLNKRVLWVTHRLGLRRQARRALQQLLKPGHKLREDAVSLADRIDFIMVSELESRLKASDLLPALVIVDEAHHAAAASYDPLFEVDVPVLGLTATPRRTDLQPIRVDDIAYQITYRELAERGVILKPEFRDFPVENFDWSQDAIEELADELITGAQEDYVKTLVIAPRIDRVEEFYNALTQRLAAEKGHVLALDDVGFIHSERNSLNVTGDEFLDVFANKPRGIIVSAQMLLEGFDDPAINTVMVTYPSSSVLLLMQAAGRCVRHAEGKQSAYVIQARNDQLAYHFDQRWLYQEISDILRPDLVDVSYADNQSLVSAVTMALDSHRVKQPQRDRILAEVAQLSPGQLCRVMFAGLPYSGSTEDFVKQAEWSAILETSSTSEQFLSLFNEFSENGEEYYAQAFLAKVGARVGVHKDLTPGSSWRDYSTLYASMVNARREISDNGVRIVQEGRPYQPNGSTTWLRYFTFAFEPQVPIEMSNFLSDCYNRDAVIGEFLAESSAYKLAIKIAMPMGGFEAHLLRHDEAPAFDEWIAQGRKAVGSSSAENRFSAFAAFSAASSALEVPRRVLDRLEVFLDPVNYARQVLDVSSNSLVKPV